MILTQYEDRDSAKTKMIAIRALTKDKLKDIKGVVARKVLKEEVHLIGYFNRQEDFIPWCDEDATLSEVDKTFQIIYVFSNIPL
jgi:endonuclease III-like uncharacterized protein